MTPTPTRLYTASAVFFVGMAAVVYGIMNPGYGEGNRAVGAVVLVGIALLHFGAGFAARSWWVVPWPPLVVLLSMPAGITNEPHVYEAFPIWFGMLIFLEPAGLILIVLGVVAAKLMARRQRRHHPRPPTRLLHHGP